MGLLVAIPTGILSTAGTTIPEPVGALVGVRFSHDMSVLTTGLPDTTHVFSGGYGFQVKGINTVANMAEMVYLVPSGYWADQQFVSKPMGVDGSTSSPLTENPIAVMGATSNPEPASLGLVDLGPEALFGGKHDSIT